MYSLFDRFILISCNTTNDNNYRYRTFCRNRAWLELGLIILNKESHNYWFLFKDVISSLYENLKFNSNVEMDKLYIRILAQLEEGLEQSLLILARNTNEKSKVQSSYLGWSILKTNFRKKVEIKTSFYIILTFFPSLPLKSN